MSDEQEVLEEAGLSKNEARAYLLLAREGKMKVSDIAAKTGLQRRTLYDTLQRLESRGLAGRAEVSGVIAFTASPPASLLSFVDGKREALEAILPELSKPYEKEERIEVSVMYGTAGVKTVLQDIVKLRPKYYYAYRGQMQFFDMIPKTMDIFNGKRKRLGIRTRYLLLDTPQVRANARRMWLAEIKFIKPTTLSPGVWWTYGDRVVLWVLPKGGEALAIFIKHKELARAFQDSFERMYAAEKTPELKVS